MVFLLGPVQKKINKCSYEMCYLVASLKLLISQKIVTFTRILLLIDARKNNNWRRHTACACVNVTAI